jgi:hypothetical protein
MFPAQLIPEEKKDKEWMKMCVSAITKMTTASWWGKQKDRFCYNFFEGIENESDYNYLTKVDKYEYPAKLRFVPLIRPQLDYLISEETKRPFSYRVFSIDHQALQRKETMQMQMLFGKIKDNFVARNLQIQEAMQQIQQAQQQQMQAEQQAQQPQEGQEQQPQVQPLDPQQKQMLELQAQKIKLQSIFSKKDLDEIDKFMKYEYRDLSEIVIQKGMQYLIEYYDIKDKFTEGFKTQLKTDKEVYFVDWNGEDEDPIFRRVEDLNFFHSGDDEAEWIDQCEWTQENRWMTFAQILDEFKDDLTVEDIEKLKNRNFSYTSQSNYFGYTDRHMYNNSTDPAQINAVFSGGESFANRVRVSMVYWKSPREINVKYSPSKYNKDLKHIHIVKQHESADKEKGEEKIAKYITDIYHGIEIDNDIYVRLGKKKVQFRGVDKLKTALPYIGFAYNNHSRRPYSLVWATREIQQLYNIIHYHKELMLALSGAKGFIMDKSQMPDGMSMAEWSYQRKMGRGWIQTVKEGRAVSSGFNQFQQYDDTLSPAIQYLVSILTHLEELARSVTGVSRQRTGTIAPLEKVGNTEASIQQSSIITESLFWKHDRVKKRALTRLANLCRFAWRKGKRAQYITGQFGQEILNIAPNTLDDSEFELFVGDGFKEETALTTLRQVAFQSYGKIGMSMSDLIKIYSIDNLKELEATLSKIEDIAHENASNTAQAERDWEKEKIKMEGDIKIMIEKQKGQFMQMTTELDKLKLQLDQKNFEIDQENKQAESDKRMQLEREKTGASRETELLYLKEEKMQSDKQLMLEQQKLDLQKAIAAKQNNVSIKNLQMQQEHASYEAEKDREEAAKDRMHEKELAKMKPKPTSK